MIIKQFDSIPQNKCSDELIITITQEPELSNRLAAISSGAQASLLVGVLALAYTGLCLITKNKIINDDKSYIEINDINADQEASLSHSQLAFAVLCAPITLGENVIYILAGDIVNGFTKGRIKAEKNQQLLDEKK